MEQIRQYGNILPMHFARQYCLLDVIDNVIDLDSYVSSLCELLTFDIIKAINSF